MHQEIPKNRPNTPLLNRVYSPKDIRQLNTEQLAVLADELRHYLLYCVGQTGGHFGAGLGVIELTIALHYTYRTPNDRIVWDVGHQSYPHKILTGRREQMLTMRQHQGLSGFPKRSESEYDCFGVGHASTSISASLGMALANQQTHPDRKHIAVIGDGAMTGGMAFEALNHAVLTEADLLVVLNDNNMSISRRAGGVEYPDQLFANLGLSYSGPIDGHDLQTLCSTLETLKGIPGPKVLHIITQKGKGYRPAEADPVGYHAIDKMEPITKRKPCKAPKYQAVFGQWLCDMAEKDHRLVGITPAMCEGSGMVEFSQRFPKRFYDVAIAEQHAVTLAAGFACEDMKPVVAIYSTFLQRAYDQVIHDVALQNLDVTFAIDRAGIVGEDGPSHSGNFDIAFLRCIPNFVIATPSDENECRQLLSSVYQHPGPAAVRYPRGKGFGSHINNSLGTLAVGKSKCILKGKDIAILNFGTLLPAGFKAAESLNATLIDMRWVKPLDKRLIESLPHSHKLLVTIEDGCTTGGAGSAVMECLHSSGINIPVLVLGLPDEFVEHGKREDLLSALHLNPDKIEQKIIEKLNFMG